MTMGYAAQQRFGDVPSDARGYEQKVKSRQPAGASMANAFFKPRSLSAGSTRTWQYKIRFLRLQQRRQRPRFPQSCHHGLCSLAVTSCRVRWQKNAVCLPQLFQHVRPAYTTKEKLEESRKLYLLNTKQVLPVAHPSSSCCCPRSTDPPVRATASISERIRVAA